MARYEVQLDLQATVWIDVEADSEEQAEEYARQTYTISDAQWMEVTDVEIKKYAEGAA